MNNHNMNICPKCNQSGQPVTNHTATHIVKAAVKDSIGSADVHLCQTPHCNVGYFNNAERILIDKSDFKRPIWFKEGAEPVYACYCKSITEDEILKTVVETNLNDMQSIMLFLRGSLGSQCRVTNPAGHCCSEAFNQMIEKGMKIKRTLLEYAHLAVDSKQVDKKSLRQDTNQCKSSCCSDTK